jgi:hypothetical protein
VWKEYKLTNCSLIFKYKTKTLSSDLKIFVLYFMHFNLFLFGTGLLLCLSMTAQLTFGVKGKALSNNWEKISLQKMKAKLIDAELNHNGKFSNPEERIRLLYLDTLELSKSHKGKDRKFGLPS